MITPITAESVLRQLRQLPPRDRLRVVSQVLPELEQDLPAWPAFRDFWRAPISLRWLKNKVSTPSITFKRCSAAGRKRKPLTILSTACALSASAISR